MQRIREARLVNGTTTPYVELDRTAWSRLAASTPLPLTAEEVERLRGLADEIDLAEVREVYLPLTRLLNLYVRATGALHQATQTFLTSEPPHPGEPGATGANGTNGGVAGAAPTAGRTPFVIGIAGSVAVGKSTVARLLRELLARWPDHPRVSLVTTDGFLLPNAELERRGLLQRKGFPESYDQRALLRFVVAVKSGVPVVTAPVYSHLKYDIVPDKRLEVRAPDILLIEGLNVLQPARAHEDGRRGLAVSDFFDFSIYLDASPADVREWYVKRFLALRETAFRDEESYFRRYADLSHAEAVERACRLWDTINGPNLEQNVQPTRGRARLVLHKGADHSVTRVRLRKI
ncbi:type I pantothenate kinase [Actinopolymorpha singaporensis]|uniref:Pantothenate kinase n=1 Tax=Actinopolymorpha singaporensis TaxID=117157 RepID=A0A1H1SET7_9ACTN|nr:type I pantothenate kinase [Actinopolymorpha singaporensis]SDS46441.1 pantothenate kinase [Actinopolymorpha singaporensis]